MAAVVFTVALTMISAFTAAESVDAKTVSVTIEAKNKNGSSPGDTIILLGGASSGNFNSFTSNNKRTFTVDTGSGHSTYVEVTYKKYGFIETKERFYIWVNPWNQTIPLFLNN